MSGLFDDDFGTTPGGSAPVTSKPDYVSPETIAAHQSQPPAGPMDVTQRMNDMTSQPGAAKSLSGLQFADVQPAGTVPPARMGDLDLSDTGLDPAANRTKTTPQRNTATNAAGQPL